MRGLISKTFLALAGVVLAVACTSTSADQCTAGASGDLDCERVLGVATGQAFCDLGTCRQKGLSPPAATNGDGGTTAASCTSTEQCTADAGGKPSVCREPGVKPCVPLTTDRCTVYGDGWKQAKNPIFVGVLLSKTLLSDGTVQAYPATNERSVRLAEEEWLAATTGGLNVGGERRPIVGVYCDIGADPDTTRAAFDFVTLGLGAPAVITDSPLEAAWFLDAAEERKTFVYLTEYGCDDIAPSGKLASRCYTNSPPYDSSGPLMKEWVKATEGRMRDERGLAAGDKLKLVLLAARAGQTASTSAFIDQLRIGLELNGAAVSGQPDQFREVNPLRLDDGTIDYLRTAQTIADFQPDIVVTLEARDFHLWYMPLIEASWPSSATYRPHYIGSDNIAFARRFAVSVGGSEDLRRRVDGVWTALDDSTQPIFDDFLTRWQARWGEENVDGISTGFDAWYGTAFGIAAALTSSTVNGAALTGADVGAAMKRLSSGTTTKLLPGTIASSLGTLQAGGAIDLVGTQTTMDWNVVNGCAGADSAVFCVGRDEGQALYVDDLGVYWHHKDGAFDPPLPITLSCE